MVVVEWSDRDGRSRYVGIGGKLIDIPEIECGCIL
jgi:hypothetical protein